MQVHDIGVFWAAQPAVICQVLHGEPTEHRQIGQAALEVIEQLKAPLYGRSEKSANWQYIKLSFDVQTHFFDQKCFWVKHLLSLY